MGQDLALVLVALDPATMTAIPLVITIPAITIIIAVTFVFAITTVITITATTSTTIKIPENLDKR